MKATSHTLQELKPYIAGGVGAGVGLSLSIALTAIVKSVSTAVALPLVIGVGAVALSMRETLAAARLTDIYNHQGFIQAVLKDDCRALKSDEVSALSAKSFNCYGLLSEMTGIGRVTLADLKHEVEALASENRASCGQSGKGLRATSEIVVQVLEAKLQKQQMFRAAASAVLSSLAGASFGSLAGGVGAPIGALVGAVIGFGQALFAQRSRGDIQQQLDQVYKALNPAAQSIRAEQSTQIEQSTQTDFKFDRPPIDKPREKAEKAEKVADLPVVSQAVPVSRVELIPTLKAKKAVKIKVQDIPNYGALSRPKQNLLELQHEYASELNAKPGRVSMFHAEGFKDFDKSSVSLNNIQHQMKSEQKQGAYFASSQIESQEYYQLHVLNFAGELGGDWKRNGVGQEEVAVVECRGLAEACGYANAKNISVNQAGDQAENAKSVLVETQRVGQVIVRGAALKAAYRKIDLTTQSAQSVFVPLEKAQTVNWLTMADSSAPQSSRSRGRGQQDQTLIGEALFATQFKNALTCFMLGKARAEELGQPLKVVTAALGHTAAQNPSMSLLAQYAAAKIAHVDSFTWHSTRSEPMLEKAVETFEQALQQMNETLPIKLTDFVGELGLGFKC